MLKDAMSSWGNGEFSSVQMIELLALDVNRLPLQNALSSGHYVSDDTFELMIINCRESDDSIVVKAGVFFNGVISGCNCADDSSTGNAITNEYCELLFTINKVTEEFDVTLLSE